MMRLLPLFLLFGVFSALISFIISFSFRIYRDFMRKILKKNRWFLQLIGSIIFTILFIIFDIFLQSPTYSIYGADLTYLNSVFLDLNSQLMKWDFLILFFFFYLFGLILSIGSDNSAGVIGPLFLLGGFFGGFFGLIFYPENPELFVLLGISSILGSTTKNPIASIFIIIEVTWYLPLIISAGICTIISYILSGPLAIIEGQNEKRIPSAIS